MMPNIVAPPSCVGCDVNGREEAAAPPWTVLAAPRRGRRGADGAIQEVVKGSLEGSGRSR